MLTPEAVFSNMTRAPNSPRSHRFNRHCGKSKQIGKVGLPRLDFPT